MGALRANDSATHAVDGAVVDSICDAFESTWKSGHQPKIEDYLARAGADERSTLLVELILVEYDLRRNSGETPTIDEYLRRFPDDAPVLRERLLRELETAGLPASSLAAHAREELKPGELWGRFQLLALLGRGGFGEVWRARDPLLNREVAIKTLRSDKPISDRLNQELVREGQRVAQLNHEHIVRVLHAEIVNGRAFLVSDLKEGGTLQSRLRDGGAIDRVQAVRWMIDVAHALQAAHEQGFVHRDLKPGNLLFDGKGNIAIADFGLAVSELDQLSEPAGMMGTWAYASPEQARGESRQAEPRSDLYSLGVIIYQLLTGRLPFQANTVEQYKQQILEREPRPLRAINSDIPIELETICLACLRKEIANRPASAQEIAERLESWLQSVTANRPRGRETETRPEFAQRFYRPALFAVVATVAVGALVLGILAGLNKPDESNSVAEDAQLPAWADPTLRVWEIRDADIDRRGYDEERAVYEFDSTGTSLFQSGWCTGDELTLQSTLQILSTDRTGRTGVYWGWDSVIDDPAVRSCCWGLEIGRLSVDSPDYLVINQYDIGPGSGGHHVILATSEIRSIESPLLQDSRVVLKVVVTEDQIKQLFINGKSILNGPVELEQPFAREWTRLKQSGYGFLGVQGRFAVESFAAN